MAGSKSYHTIVKAMLKSGPAGGNKAVDLQTLQCELAQKEEESSVSGQLPIKDPNKELQPLDFNPLKNKDFTDCAEELRELALQSEYSNGNDSPT